MFVHRLSLSGPEAECSAMASWLGRRPTTAWGPEDVIFRHCGKLLRSGCRPDDIVERLDAALRRDTGYGFEDVSEVMDPFDRLLLTGDPQVLAERCADLDDPAAADAFVIETGLPGLSLTTARPVPHVVAMWGADPVGRLWRRDNWGSDTEILPLATTFSSIGGGSSRRRVIEFAAHVSMPISAFLSASQGWKDVVVVVTGQMASIDGVTKAARDGGSIACAATAFCAGETITSEIVDMAGLLDIRRAAAFDAEGTMRGVLAGLEETFLARIGLD